MKRSLGRKTSAATLVAAAVWLSAVPALAQSLGGTAQYCRNVGGRLVCSPAAASSGTRPYEHWDNGAPAQGSGSSTVNRSYDNAHGFPQSFGAYGALHGFGH